MVTIICLQFLRDTALNIFHLNLNDLFALTFLIFLLFAITTISLLLYLNTTKKKALQLKELLEEVDKKRKTLDALFQYSPVGILITDSNGKILSFNNEFVRLFGLATDTDIVGQTVFDFISKETFETCKDAMRKLENGANRIISEFDISVPSGEIRNIRHICSGFGASFYEVDTFIHIFVDLTELKNYQNLLKKNEEKYKTYIELSTDAIWCFESPQPLPISLPIEQQIDLIYRYAYLADCNLTFAKFYGFESIESAKGTPISKIISLDNPTKAELLRRFIENNYSLDGFVTVVQDRNGNNIYVRNSLFGIVENGFVLRAWGSFQNITEIVNLQKKYQETASRYENLLENANSIILNMDLSGNILYMNQFGLNFFGYSRDELIGKNVIGTIVPKIESSTERNLELLIKEVLQDPIKFEQNENENIKKDGTKVWIAWKNTPIYDNNGNLVEVLSVGIDITDKKRKEEELKQTWNFIFSMLDALPFGVAIKDPKGLWVYSNRSMLEIFNLIGKEVIGKTDLELIEYDEFYREAFETCIASDKTTWENGKASRFRESVKTKDGYIRIFDVIKVPAYNIDGSRRGLVVIGGDITAQVKAEEALKSSEKQYREIVEHLPLPAFVVHNEQIIFSNQIAKYTFGEIFTTEVVPFSNLTKYFSNDELSRIFDAILKPDGKTKSQIQIRTKNEQTIYSVSSVPFVFGILDSFLVVFYDITEQVKYQEHLEKIQKELIFKSKELERINNELNQKNKELSELNATKDRFFSIIVHDLKNPIYGIKSLSDEFVRSFDELKTEEMRDFIFAIQTSSTKLADLLEELLIWARTQTKSTQFNPVELNLKFVVDSAVSFFQNSAQKKHIVLLSRIDDSVIVFADSNSTYTISRNLVSNAIKFTNEGGVVRIYSKTIEENGEKFEQISVQDNGVGIPYEVQDKLLQLDFVYTTPGTNNEIGTGLGLSIVKELVKINGGRLWFESKPNSGTTFHFTLPKRSK